MPRLLRGESVEALNDRHGREADDPSILHEYKGLTHQARSREEVQAFYKAAIAAGGRDNGAPGLRSDGRPPGYYAAFVLGPDGNNIEAVFRER